MQSAQFYKAFAILVLLCTGGANAEFGAFVPELVHIPAQLNVAIRDELLRNGLYAEIVGEVADRKEACGVVLLDYSAYVDGALFEAAIKPIEEYLLKASKDKLVNGTLRSEVYKTMKSTALAGHKSDMRALFEMRRASTPLYRSTELRFFPYAGVVALGVGMGLGGLIFEGLAKIMEDNKLEKFEQKSLNIWKGIMNTLQSIVDEMTFRVSSVQFGSAFALVRYQVYVQVRDTLDQLFGFGRVAEELLERSSNRSLMSAIERLVGERFNLSLLALHGTGARDALKATVIGMNRETMEIKICYPTTMTSDINYLVRVEPLGQFLPNMTSYWMHDIGGLYAIEKAEHKHINLATLKMVQHESLCRHASSVMLCSLQEQRTGCGLLSANRHNCPLVIYNSTEEHFTVVRPLARSVIIATRAKRMHEMPQEIGKPRPANVVTQPVFAVEVPRGKWLIVGDKIIHSRVVQGVMGADFKVIVPDATPDYTPDAMPHVASDFWIWPNFDTSTLLPLLVSLLAIVISLLAIVNSRAAYREQCTEMKIQSTNMAVLNKDYKDMKEWKEYFEEHYKPRYPSVPNIY